MSGTKRDGDLLIKLGGATNFRAKTFTSTSQAFEVLKERLITTLVLTAPDWELPFEVMCDASDTAVGEILGQRKNKIS